MKTLSSAQTPTYTGPMDSEQRRDSDPREFFRLLWRRKWIILLCLTLIPLAVYVYSDRLTKTYQASTIIQVQSTATDAGLFLDEALPTRRGEHRQDRRAGRHERRRGPGGTASR